eukprot:1729704-Prymnesium_polylepis.1
MAREVQASTSFPPRRRSPERAPCGGSERYARSAVPLARDGPRAGRRVRARGRRRGRRARGGAGGAVSAEPPPDGTVSTYLRCPLSHTGY